MAADSSAAKPSRKSGRESKHRHTGKPGGSQRYRCGRPTQPSGKACGSDGRWHANWQPGSDRKADEYSASWHCYADRKADEYSARWPCYADRKADWRSAGWHFGAARKPSRQAHGADRCAR